MYDNSIFTEWEALRRRDALIEGVKNSHAVHELHAEHSRRGVRAAIASALMRLARAIDSNAGTRPAAAG